MTSPNLFDYATKELSQDAMICWLIDWAGTETDGDSEKEKLRQFGRAFVDALFQKWRDWGYEVELDEVIRTEVWPQEHRIDILARVNGHHVLLIEDKTNTGAHGNQLEEYWSLVASGRTRLGEVAEDSLWPIYFRTGNHSFKEEQKAEESGYAVFKRCDFLRVLETYRGTSEILIDFRRHMKRWEEETNSFLDWTKGSQEWKTDGYERSEKSRRAKHGWEGFYRFIEEDWLKKLDDEWGALGSLVGGYNGLWIEPSETSRGSKFAIWIIEDKISFRLYGAENGVSEQGMNREKDYWASKFVEQDCNRLKRPSVLRHNSIELMAVSCHGR
ncbi:MAG: PD-(D/E)XK nuclease family protein, partial [Gammaproteobacteria bacterium]|nr:PD-(D/E)XK nuclease family protein [Gammaproteobacteria bacterium]